MDSGPARASRVLVGVDVQNQDEAAAEVAAMQFAGGMSIEHVASLWDQDTGWVEAAVRRELLKLIPKRDGGLKASRTESRASRMSEARPAGPEQGALRW